jgi:hypothetical protein
VPTAKLHVLRVPMDDTVHAMVVEAAKSLGIDVVNLTEVPPRESPPVTLVVPITKSLMNEKTALVCINALGIGEKTRIIGVWAKGTVKFDLPDSVRIHARVLVCLDLKLVTKALSGEDMNLNSECNDMAGKSLKDTTC